MLDFFKIIIFVIGGCLSQRYADSYWGIGPLFGAVVVIWQAKKVQEIFSLKNFIFLAASTFIYAFVYYLSNHGKDYASPILGIFLSALSVGVLAGSFLLPLAQKFIFGGSWELTLKTFGQLILSFYLISVADAILKSAHFAKNMNLLALAIFLWQGLYVYNFFLKMK